LTAGGGTGTRRDLVLLVLLGVAWGSAFPVIRLGLLASAAPIAFGVGRFALAAGLMAAVSFARREAAPDRRSLLLSALVGGCLLIGAYAAFLYLGEEAVTAGVASILIATLPLFSLLVGYRLLPGERLSAAAGAGMAVGFAGVVLLFLPDLFRAAGGEAVAALLVLGAALSGAIGSVLIRRLVAHPTGSWGLTAEFAAAAALLGGLAIILPGEDVLPATPVVWGSLLYLAIVPSVGGYSVYFYLIHHVGPARANLVAYVNPLTAVLLGVALLGESVTVEEVGGFVLVALGLFLVQRASRPRPPPPTNGSPSVPP
jgi:drug/metabolite transporter (DMT)-like permease